MKTKVVLFNLLLSATLLYAAPAEESVQITEKIRPAPMDNPLEKYGLKWTEQVNWTKVVVISDFKGNTPEERLRKAQSELGEKGGVVYCPPGVYKFTDSISIGNGVVIRGAEPTGIADAHDERYKPPTRFEFPQYIPKFSGNGTPNATAFKGIYLENIEQGSNCGIVNIAINRGHIHFKEGLDHKSGRNRLVYGCVLKNTAVADPAIPHAKSNQHPWQRFTQRHHAAIDVKASENILIANNRLPESGEDNFEMRGYLIEGASYDVVFDYDNRPGLYINSYGIGGPGGSGPSGTPDTHPWGFRKGIVIRDNYIFNTGRCAISFTGDGTVCANNIIRFKDDVWRPTCTGFGLSKGSSTNDNRAIQMRGYRWKLIGNDYLVYRNWAAGRGYRINDGEGMMHEDHVNSAIIDSVVEGNKGNSYISLYKTGGIDGLLVKDNDIRTNGGIAAIYVVANRNSGPYECKNVTIIGNTTAGSGIQITGSPASNNVIKDNTHIGGGGDIINQANARIENNASYKIATEGR